MELGDSVQAYELLVEYEDVHIVSILPERLRSMERTLRKRRLELYHEDMRRAAARLGEEYDRSVLNI